MTFNPTTFQTKRRQVEAVAFTPDMALACLLSGELGPFGIWVVRSVRAEDAGTDRVEYFLYNQKNVYVGVAANWIVKDGDGEHCLRSETDDFLDEFEPMAEASAVENKVSLMLLKTTGCLGLLIKGASPTGAAYKETYEEAKALIDSISNEPAAEERK